MKIQSTFQIYSKLFLTICSIFFTQTIVAQQEFLIRFQPNTDIGIIEKVLNDLSAEKIRTFNITTGSLIPQIYHIQRIESAMELGNLTLKGKEEILAYYNQHSDVKYMEENYDDYELAFMPLNNNFDDPWLSDQWHLEKIRAMEAFGLLSDYNSVQTVEVAVLDTGVDYHEDIDGNFSPLQVLNLMNYNADVDDDLGHATHIMGILAAVSNNTTGIVGFPNVKVLPVKIFDFNNAGELRTTTTAIIDGILHAITRGTPIINCSFGGASYSQALYDVLKYAEEEGHLIIAAAGNQSRDIEATPFYPASYSLENIIAVGASDSNDERADISNSGAESVDIFAPGEHILSTFPGNDYCRKSGTSMAAPLVGAVAAMILGICEGMPPAIVKKIIVSSADNITDLNGLCVANGRLNARAALEAAECSFYAYFNATNYAPCLDELVTFEAQVLPDIVNAFWMIDGILVASNTFSSNSTFDTEGIHTVSLTVQNVLGELDTYETIVNVRPSLADASFNIDQQGNTIAFNPTIQNPVYSYFWNFGDGISSQLMQPFHVFTKGDYIVSLVITNDCGSQIVEKKIVVDSNIIACPNTPTFTLSPSNICAGEVVYFDNTSNGFTHFGWIINEKLLVTGTTSNPDFDYTPLGSEEILEITLVGFNKFTGCASSLTQMVFIDQDAIFPGDVNLDGVVNQEDMQLLEIALGASGPARTTSNPTEFRPQCSQDWNTTFTNGINHKHADTDGSGEINELDEIVICDNWGLTNADNLITPPQESSVAELELQASAVYHPNTETIKVTYELVSLNEGNINLESLSFESSLEEVMETIESVELENSISETNTAFLGCDNTTPPVNQIPVVIGDIGSWSNIELGVSIQFFTTTGRITDVLAGEEEETFCVNIPITNVVGLDDQGNPIQIKVNTQVYVEVIDEVCNTSFHTSFPTAQKQDLRVYETIQMADGGFLTAANQNNDNALLIKSDEEGNVEWERSFDSGKIEEIYTLIATKDGGVLVLGVQRKNQEDTGLIYLMKLDEEGNLVIAKKIESGLYSRAYKITALKNGKYAIAGFSQKQQNVRVLLFVIVDEKGNVLESYEMGKSSIAVEWIELEEGYALVGEAYNYKTDCDNLLFARLTKDMEVESVKWFAYDDKTDVIGFGIRPTPDGGYILLGQTEDKLIEEESRQAFVLKLDKKEKLEWAKTLEADGVQYALSVIVNENETYTVSAGAFTYLPSLSNHYILTLNKNGNVIQNKSVRLGGEGNILGAFVNLCEDGSLISANVKWENDGNEGISSTLQLWKSERDLFSSLIDRCEISHPEIRQKDITRDLQVYSRRGFLKEIELTAEEIPTVKSELSVETEVHCRKVCKNKSLQVETSKDKLTPSIEQAISLKDLYPNPVRELLSVEIRNTSSMEEKARIEVYDYMGNLQMVQEVLLQSHHNKLTMNTSDLPSGMHILQVKFGENIISRRFIKQ